MAITTVTNVSATTANGTYKLGDTLILTVTFSGPVTVDTSNGTPVLLFETGKGDGFATYVSGSGTDTLSFSYTVQNGEVSPDLNYASSGALLLNGGTIVDSISVNADLTLPSPGAAGSLDANKDLVIDGALPDMVDITMTDTELRIGDSATVTFTFTERVNGFAVQDVTAENGSFFGLASADGGLTWTGTFRPSANVTDPVNTITVNLAGVVDLAGNSGAGVAFVSYKIDTARPTATISLSDTVLAAGETATVTVTFSEAVFGFSTADLSAQNGTLNNLSSVDGGITWTATFTPSATVTDLSNVISLDMTGVTDLNGNFGIGTTDSGNYAVDTVRPTLNMAIGDTDLTSGETTIVTFTFSEAVTGFSTTDLTVANGSVANLSTLDGGITWTGTLTPATNVNDATNVVTVAMTGLTDIAGNAGTGTVDSPNYTVDTPNLPPALTGDLRASLSEGGSYVLTATDLFYTDIDDGDADMTFRVTNQTAGTILVNGLAATSFTGTDLAAGDVSFRHDGSETTSASFRVSVDDGNEDASTPTTAPFAFSVTPVNDSPSLTATQLVTGIDEGTAVPADLKIANLAITDADGGTNLLALGGADAGNFLIRDGALWLKQGSWLDFETDSRLDVTVSVDDATIGTAVEDSMSLHVDVRNVIEDTRGSGGSDEMLGTSAGDLLKGLSGADVLSGGDGNDTLWGGRGLDRLIGGGGADLLRGGPGRDIFVFLSADDSAPGIAGTRPDGSFDDAIGEGLRDVILDFRQGADRIDLSAIDFDPVAPGVQAPDWLGRGSFDGLAGQLLYRQFDARGTADDRTIVYGDIDADGAADFQIELSGLINLRQDDFLLA